MNDILLYLLKVSVFLFFLYTYYRLFLHNWKHYQYNRFYLLFASLLSFLLPGIAIDFSFVPPELQKYSLPVSHLTTNIPIENMTTQVTDRYLSIPLLLFSVYLIGCSIRLSILIYKIAYIFLLIHGAETKKVGNIVFVYIDRPDVPFSFLHYLFLTHSLQQSGSWKLMYQHEIAHISKKHTYDLLILEFIMVILWFNPIFWLLKQKLTEIHEFQADDAVLNANHQSKAYQKVILHHSIKTYKHSLVHSLGSHLIKRRIEMIQNPPQSGPMASKIVIFFSFILILLFVNNVPAKDLNFMSPVKKGRVTSEFGMRMHPFSKKLVHHDGIDIAAPKGTPVFAITGGIIGEAAEKPGYGKYILVIHDDDWSSLYTQLAQIVIRDNQHVKKGDLLGYVGSSGRSTAPHLHFELWQKSDPQNPRHWIDFSSLK